MKEFASVGQGFSLISNRKLLALYFAMVECRRIADSSTTRRNGKVRHAGVDSILGHEAAVVGAAIDLLAGDTIAPALRPEAALKAINLIASFAPKLALATRAARAGKSARNVSLLFVSSKRAAQPSWLRALTLAAEQDLPIVFVLLSQPQTSEAPRPFDALHLQRKHYSLPIIHVEGNDVVAVYRVASEAFAHARKGHGPTLIDCRFSIPADPLQNMKNYLVGKGLEAKDLAS